MAHPKRNSRRITIGERIYRWYYGFDEEEYDVPRLVTVSVMAEDNLNGAAAYASARYGGAVTPSIVRRIIDTALSGGWDPDANKTHFKALSDFQATCCFLGFPRSMTHADSEFLCTLVEKDGLHMRIRSTAHPRAQELVTFCTLGFADCTEQLATAFIDFALDLGWQPARKSRDVFWLQEEYCSKIIASCRHSSAHK